MAAVKENTMLHKFLKKFVFILLVLASMMLTGCDGNVGVGVSVGVPIGNHGHMRVGGHRWY
jgi:predicted small secreted protein